MSKSRSRHGRKRFSRRVVATPNRSGKGSTHDTTSNTNATKTSTDTDT
jgi:hypothetical protein